MSITLEQCREFRKEMFDKIDNNFWKMITIGAFILASIGGAYLYSWSTGTESREKISIVKIEQGKIQTKLDYIQRTLERIERKLFNERSN